ncbi:MAG: 3-deoxy-D-manno-octulosonic-acid transferase [Planctomycetota bacterium]|jgi:3-deoxy-D-manno-octulosonic-acid transferase
MHFGYDMAWLLAAVVGSPWLIWNSLLNKGFGRMVIARSWFGLPPRAPANSRQRILLHGVSVGEVKVAVPLVRLLAELYPEYEVVISTTTNTGMAVAKSVLPGIQLVRFPADISWWVKSFLQRVKPCCVVLIELEIWPNFLREANRAGIPVAVVNGRITEKSYDKYHSFRLALPQFNRISLFCVQGGDYARRFRDLYVDADRVIETGNIKADGLQIGPVEPGEELRRFASGRPEQMVLVAGSTHFPEELWVAEAWREAMPGSRLILVPRHPKRVQEILRGLSTVKIVPQLLSNLRAGTEQPDPDRPLVVDTIGELERIYGLADIVFVGGTLVDHGGQNMLEPAAQGRAVLYGPSIDNFQQEARLLGQAGACRVVANQAELAIALAELAGDPELCGRMAHAGLAVVEAQKGAALATLKALHERCLAKAPRA